ncbi:hypothetical protein FOA52_009394 [Chlamydomonas sp. UWO 241]|nr:hypothetical protein FOA52_009394 [Chlamydomonas sp. UWO 241]
MGSGVPPMDATLLLRAARDLPVEALGQELYDVLLRRTVKAGGSPDDPALPRLISFLSRSSIPSTMLTPAGDHVSRGGVIQFSRRSAVQQQQLAASQQQQQRAEVHGDGSAAASGLQVQQALITAALEYTPGLPTAALGGGGVNGAGVDVVGGGGVDACEIVASAGGQPLGSVSSCALSAALFDLYMGDDPVCQKAKSRAEHAVARVAADGARARYVPGKDERLVCTGRSGDGGGDQPATCVIELLH